MIETSCGYGPGPNTAAGAVGGAPTGVRRPASGECRLARGGPRAGSAARAEATPAAVGGERQQLDSGPEPLEAAEPGRGRSYDARLQARAPGPGRVDPGGCVW